MSTKYEVETDFITCILIKGAQESIANCDTRPTLEIVTRTNPMSTTDDLEYRNSKKPLQNLRTLF